jgi:hypothetical protein
MSWHRPIIHRHGPVRHSLRCGGLAALIGAMLGSLVGGTGKAESPGVQATATARVNIISSAVRVGPGQVAPGRWAAPSSLSLSGPERGERRSAPQRGERTIVRPCDGADTVEDCRLIIRDMP